jgi:predicted aspartyl protease
MNLFQNGRGFQTALRCAPPGGQKVPFVTVEIAAGDSDVFVMVEGKVDTGAFRTMLTFETAERLGVRGSLSTAAPRTARTATDAPFSYYEQLVSVRIGDPGQEVIEFPFVAAFADKLPRNLFGVDWLAHLCVAVDAQAVHFLRD